MSKEVKFIGSANNKNFSFDQDPKILKETQKTTTYAQYTKVTHNSANKESRQLKIYKQGFNKKEIILSSQADYWIKFIRENCNLSDDKLQEIRHMIEASKARNQITIDEESINELIEYLRFFDLIKDGGNHLVKVDSTISELIKTIQGFEIKENKDFLHVFNALFKTTNSKQIAELIIKSNLSYADIQKALEIKKKEDAVDQFEKMLSNNLTEANWQRWFEENSWVLGSDFVEVLDERKIDTKNITDYLVKSYDGFLDIIEIKRPEGGRMDFWAKLKDRNNLIPSSDLIKAITQATKYIYEVERESNSIKFRDRVKVPVVKPRSTLVFGRSYQWKEEENEAYRILNSGYHNLLIITYDHVLDRAKRILKNLSSEKEKILQYSYLNDDEDIQF